jgi:hypothetical protein
MSTRRRPRSKYCQQGKILKGGMNNIKKGTKGYYLGVLGQMQPCLRGGLTTRWVWSQMIHGRNWLSYHLRKFFASFSIIFWRATECWFARLFMSPNYDFLQLNKSLQSKHFSDQYLFSVKAVSGLSSFLRQQFRFISRKM